MTQPEDKADPFFDPDIIYPDAGESAIIIQPNGKIPIIFIRKIFALVQQLLAKPHEYPN